MVVSVVLIDAAYFDSQRALMHGMHMVPIAPCSGYLRGRAFVKEEWDTVFSDGRAVGEDVQGGWRGVVHGNLAMVDARTSWAFFRDGVDMFWDDGWIDGGATRAWYLVWAAGMGELARGRA
jgi:endo-1,3(4)-beta-glucanase